MARTFLIANVDARALSASRHNDVSRLVVATDVEREYRVEDEVGEVKRGDVARDAAKR